MTSLGDIAHELKNAYRRLGGWRLVGRAYGISAGMAYRIAKQRYEPKDPHIRVRLGLPARVEVSACPHCGDVHIKRGCSLVRPRHRDLFGMPIDELSKALHNREEIA